MGSKKTGRHWNTAERDGELWDRKRREHNGTRRYPFARLREIESAQVGVIQILLLLLLRQEVVWVR